MSGVLRLMKDLASASMKHVLTQAWLDGDGWVTSVLDLQGQLLQRRPVSRAAPESRQRAAQLIVRQRQRTAQRMARNWRLRMLSVHKCLHHCSRHGAAAAHECGQKDHAWPLSLHAEQCST